MKTACKILLAALAIAMLGGLLSTFGGQSSGSPQVGLFSESSATGFQKGNNLLYVTDNGDLSSSDELTKQVQEHEKRITALESLVKSLESLVKKTANDALDGRRALLEQQNIIKSQYYKLGDRVTIEATGYPRLNLKTEVGNRTMFIDEGSVYSNPYHDKAFGMKLRKF